ncbi:MAG: ribonuclease Z [Clostridiales bacterium]|nr:ribonuclease Z [Clostridiales bacterium]
MILMACVDDNMGMLFNKRRQSQDKVLRAHILDITANSRLWMNYYSARQFEPDTEPQINIDENFLSKAAPGEFCFTEDVDVGVYEQQVEKIILFKWNRRYPGDLHFNINLSNWRLVESHDFVGSSHEKITEEVYVR